MLIENRDLSFFLELKIGNKIFMMGHIVACESNKQNCGFITILTMFS